MEAGLRAVEPHRQHGSALRKQSVAGLSAYRMTQSRSLPSLAMTCGEGGCYGDVGHPDGSSRSAASAE